MVLQVLLFLGFIYLYMFFQRCADDIAVFHKPERLLKISSSPAALAFNRSGISEASLRKGRNLIDSCTGGWGCQGDEEGERRKARG